MDKKKSKSSNIDYLETDVPLKPCPFCGGETKIALISSSALIPNLIIRCEDCHAKMRGLFGNNLTDDTHTELLPLNKAREELIERWNSRI